MEGCVCVCVHVPRWKGRVCTYLNGRVCVCVHVPEWKGRVCVCVCVCVHVRAVDDALGVFVEDTQSRCLHAQCTIIIIKQG